MYLASRAYDPEWFLKDGKLDRSVKDLEDPVVGTGGRYGSTCAAILTLLTAVSITRGGSLFGICSLTSLVPFPCPTLKHRLVKGLNLSPMNRAPGTSRDLAFQSEPPRKVY